jgi:Putative mono-oxygenase ydhR
MITAVVQFDLQKPLGAEEAEKMFEQSAPKFKNVPGLVRKYFLRSDDGRKAGGVYLWESRAAAEKVYGGEWGTRVRALYGEPQIQWFDTPVIVDNSAARATKAA